MFHLLALVIALLLMGWVGYKSYSMRGWDGIGWSPGCVRYRWGMELINIFAASKKLVSIHNMARLEGWRRRHTSSNPLFHLFHCCHLWHLCSILSIWSIVDPVGRFWGFSLSPTTVSQVQQSFQRTTIIATAPLSNSQLRRSWHCTFPDILFNQSVSDCLSATTVTIPILTIFTIVAMLHDPARPVF